MSPHPYSITGDDDKNEALAAELAGLRGHMLAQVPVSDRFVALPRTDRPAVDITDSETGRTITVGLYAARDVLLALESLFGEES